MDAVYHPSLNGAQVTATTIPTEQTGLLC
jgi:hypothetical protein